MKLTIRKDLRHLEGEKEAAQGFDSFTPGLTVRVAATRFVCTPWIGGWGRHLRHHSTHGIRTRLAAVRFAKGASMDYIWTWKFGKYWNYMPKV